MMFMKAKFEISLI